MNIKNSIFLDPSQFEAFFDKLPPNEPFIMVNLLKFRVQAEYKDGSKTTLSGAEAYQKYLDEVQSLLKEYNVQLLNDLNVFGLLLGKVQDEELWDRILLVRYPSPETFKKITQEEAFIDAQIHRTAGLAGQLNIGTKINI